MISLFLIFALAMLASAALAFAIVYSSHFFKIGQNIREEGPPSHASKKGTPIFGGVAIFAGIFIITAVFIDLDLKIKALLLLTLAFTGIGFYDDLMKVIAGKNLGLRPQQKMALQIIAALAFGSFLIFLFHETTVAGLLKVMMFDRPWLYLPLIGFVVVATTNATNLTDGLDGLLGGTAAAAFAVFAVIASRSLQFDIAGVCIAAAGALCGFLIFNFKPAKIFMGDMGSLGIGALLSGVAILLHKELLLLLIGGVFVIETLSVILQVSYFKATKGKRLFRMSPLHHHFELMGMKERDVVLMVWAVAAIFGVIGIMIR